MPATAPAAPAATTTRDYAAEYRRARVTVYTAPTPEGRARAIRKSTRILDTADAAGVRVDMITEDEAARVTANGGKPLAPVAARPTFAGPRHY